MVAPPRRCGASSSEPAMRAVSAGSLGYNGSAASDGAQGHGGPGAGDSPGDEDRAAEDGSEEGYGFRYPSYSWRETLSKFPSLMKLYPLAASSEGVVDEEPPQLGGEEGEDAGVDGEGGSRALREVDEAAEY